MRLVFLVLKVGGASIGGLLGLLLVGGWAFLSLSPEFGGDPTEAQLETYRQSGHYEGDIFVNEIPANMDMDWPTIKSLLRDYVVGVPNLEPATLLPVLKIDSADIVSKADSTNRITWFGHSAFLLETAGKNILLDPMFGPSPSPIPWLGPKRFTEGLPIEIAQLPFIDAVIFSHDHYDHLDYGSVVKLKDKVGDFYVPLGLGAHLAEWGVPADKIHEMNWWQETRQGNLTIICTPARHFSGRGITNRFSTLWSSWVVHSPTAKVYFSGDSGYGSHFADIGGKYGPFDLALLECGQYDMRWHDIHMLPEETAQAAVDLKADLMMPIHWGAFVLALHSWTDPVERVTKKAAELNMPISTPKIGQPVVIGDEGFPRERWWEAII